MKTMPPPGRARSAFTLVEMVGVLAIISILASMLAPRVFQAIADAKISNAASTCQSLKTALGEFYGRYGKIGGTNGTDLGLAVDAVYDDYDLRALVPEGYIERPFMVRIGNGLVGSANDGSRLRVKNIQGNGPNVRPGGGTAAIDSGAYNLDGLSTTNDVTGYLLVEAVIEGVEKLDAKELNDRLDGPTLGTALGTSDEVGTVKYFISTNGLAKVRVYIGHR